MEIAGEIACRMEVAGEIAYWNGDSWR